MILLYAQNKTVVMEWHFSVLSVLFGKFATVELFCFRTPAISFLGEIVAAGPFKHWELEDSEARLKVDLDVYASSLDARELPSSY